MSDRGAAARLRLLGGFGCDRRGSVVVLPQGTQRLLAFLAVRGVSHRCLVAGSLWPEVPEQQALASLRTGVWRVNKLLPGMLRVDGASLGVSDGLEVDIVRLEHAAVALMGAGRGALRRGDLARVVAATDVLWAGELLPGWYDDWVVFERERLGQLRLHALEGAARALTRAGQLDLALRLALEAVRAEPLRESARAALIEVFLAEGNTADAVHQLDSFRLLLRRELGLDPSPALLRLLPRRSGALTTL